MSRLAHTRKPAQRRRVQPGSTRNAGGTRTRSTRATATFQTIAARYPGK